MITFTKRNLKLYFRDKSSVFFSLLAVFIIIGLYTLFLGNTLYHEFSSLKNGRFIMDSWVISGILAVTSVTTTLGALVNMVDDKVKKISKDFYLAPIKRSAITGGYIFSTFLIGVIMSIVALAISEIYILVNGGQLLSIISLLKVLGLIILSSFTNTAIMGFVVSLFKSVSAFSIASTIIGTLIGFIAGVYLPIGSLPESVQFIVKLFPVSHAASLFRQVMMKDPINDAFLNIPQKYLNEFNQSMGIILNFDKYILTPEISLIILFIAAILFYALAICNMSRKK